MDDLTLKQKVALDRLIAITKRNNGQARRVADFLLAWWNAGTCGGFDLTHLWSVDEMIAADMAAVFDLIAACHGFPDVLDPAYDADFREIVARWRPDLLDSSNWREP